MNTRSMVRRNASGRECRLTEGNKKRGFSKRKYIPLHIRKSEFLKEGLGTYDDTNHFKYE